MNKQQIEQLISRFFDGATTRSEEQQLYDFFRRDDVPSDLRPYASTFLSLSARQQPVSVPAKRKPLLRRWAVAAGIAAIFCLGVAAAGLAGFSIKSTNSTEILQTESPKPGFFVFDNVEMEKVAATLGKHYKLTPVFENEAVKRKRIYMKVGKNKTIEEVLEQLNEFDGITVTVRDGKLIIS